MAVPAGQGHEENAQNQPAALGNQGQRGGQRNQLDQALLRYDKALELARQAKHRAGEAALLFLIGNLYRNRGQSAQARNHYEQSLRIWREVKPPAFREIETELLLLIGNSYLDMGLSAQALNHYEQALKIVRERKDRRGEGIFLVNIGRIYNYLGQPVKALDRYQRALKIMREWKDRLGEASTLNEIGIAYNNLGQPAKALDHYERALKIARQWKDRRAEGATLNNIGAVNERLGQSEKELDHYQQALEIMRELNDRVGEVLALNNIGSVYYRLGQPAKALDRFQQALAILREGEYPLGESFTLAKLAFLQRDQKQYAPAIDNLQRSLSIQLDVRRALPRKDRQTFLNQSQAIADGLVGLLIAQQRPADAFLWLNVFGTADLADYSRLTDAQLSDSQAQAALSQWRQQQEALAAQRQQLQDAADSRRLQLLVEQEAEQQRQAEVLISRYPEIAELLETRPADLRRLQAGIPAGTVVLQPALLRTKVSKVIKINTLNTVNNQPDTAVLFVLTRTSLQVVSVPLPQKFNDLLATYRQKLEDHQSYLQQSQQLYDLLIRPVEEKGLLPAGSRLALITSGKLREIPLETLYDSRREQYLIEKYPIHYLTRLSRSAAAASRPAGSGSGAAAARNRRALVLANPTPTKVSLHGTEAEATYLISAYPGSLDLRGSQATLSSFQQQASRYPILHLGTHGCFIPAGCTSLGMQANTLLFANGVQYPIAQAARLGLTNTELLVLAACQTARLTDDNDVGLSGLAYVLERAGARAVVASLWNALDKESSQLNQDFYANLKTGMDKAEAMRQAKLSLLRSSPEGVHPNAWAPFIVIGDAAPLGR
jgi:CHAT domain-containing protein/tetratricopeptide (TPR) repeat protein